VTGSREAGGRKGEAVTPDYMLIDPAGNRGAGRVATRHPGRAAELLWGRHIEFTEAGGVLGKGTIRTCNRSGKLLPLGGNGAHADPRVTARERAGCRTAGRSPGAGGFVRARRTVLGGGQEGASGQAAAQAVKTK